MSSIFWVLLSVFTGSVPMTFLRPIPHVVTPATIHPSSLGGLGWYSRLFKNALSQKLDKLLIRESKDLRANRNVMFA